jgi:hypothetical protein
MLLVLAAGVAPACLVGGLLSPQLARAQNLGQRVVIGTVIDASFHPGSRSDRFPERPENQADSQLLLRSHRQVSVYTGEYGGRP